MRIEKVGYPWAHGLGKDVKDCVTSKEVMQKAGLDFTVDKCQLVAKMPFRLNANNDLNEDEDDFSYKGNIYRSVSTAYATYRTDLNLPLGIVRDRYEVVQNAEVFNFFDNAIGENMAQWESAGSLGYGHKIFVTAKIPNISVVGNNDPIENYLVFSNSHDGSSSIDIMFTPIRVFCTNCLAAGIKSSDSHIRLRHTKTVSERLEQGSQVLHIACQYAKDSQDLYNHLNHIYMSDAECIEYFANMIFTDEEIKAIKEYDKEHGFIKISKANYLALEATGISTRKANIYSKMINSYFEGVGQENIIGTAWGAYNGVTNYYSNVINLEGEKRLDSLLWGNANKQINKALIDIVQFKAA